jgi:hypothetical protein
MSTGELLPKPPLQPPVVPEGVGRYRIAMIIDDIVHGVMMLETSEAAKYLSEPKFVQIPRTLYVETGFSYDGENFHYPNQ